MLSEEYTGASIRGPSPEIKSTVKRLLSELQGVSANLLRVGLTRDLPTQAPSSPPVETPAPFLPLPDLAPGLAPSSHAPPPSPKVFPQSPSPVISSPSPPVNFVATLTPFQQVHRDVSSQASIHSPLALAQAAAARAEAAANAANTTMGDFLELLKDNEPSAQKEKSLISQLTSYFFWFLPSEVKKRKLAQVRSKIFKSREEPSSSPNTMRLERDLRHIPASQTSAGNYSSFHHHTEHGWPVDADTAILPPASYSLRQSPEGHTSASINSNTHHPPTQREEHAYTLPPPAFRSAGEETRNVRRGGRRHRFNPRRVWGNKRREGSVGEGQGSDIGGDTSEDEKGHSRMGGKARASKNVYPWEQGSDLDGLPVWSGKAVHPWDEVRSHAGGDNGYSSPLWPVTSYQPSAVPSHLHPFNEDHGSLWPNFNSYHAYKPPVEKVDPSDSEEEEEMEEFGKNSVGIQADLPPPIVKIPTPTLPPPTPTTMVPGRTPIHEVFSRYLEQQEKAVASGFSSPHSREPLVPHLLLPTGWEAEWDPASARTQFFRRDGKGAAAHGTRTKTTDNTARLVANKVEEEERADSLLELASKAGMASVDYLHLPTGLPPLPAGWRAMVSRRTGLPYYIGPGSEDAPNVVVGHPEDVPGWLSTAPFQVAAGGVSQAGAEVEEIAGEAIAVAPKSRPGQALQSPSPLRDTWIRKSTESGQDYYVNLNDNSSAWQVPANGTVLLSHVSGGIPQWAEKRSKNGRVYYVHVSTGKTSWVKPLGVN